MELSVFTADATRTIQRSYYLLRGDETFHGSPFEVEHFSVSGTSVTALESQVGPHDPGLCCPSLWYRQTFTLDAGSAVAGPMIKIPAPTN